MARLATPNGPRSDTNATPILPNNTKTQKTQDASTSTDSLTVDSPPTESREHNVPSLTTEVVTSEAQLRAALKLVASSVAQQRQIAARSVIFHWRSWAIMSAIFICAHRTCLGNPADWSRVFMTYIAAMMTGLLFIRAWVAEYITEAERVGTANWLLGEDTSPNVVAVARGRKWMSPEARKDIFEEGGGQGVDIVLVTTFAEKVIATVVLRIVEIAKDCNSNSPRVKPARLGVNYLSNYAAFIRAWTVEQRYRGVGAGAAILQDTAMLCLEGNINSLAFSDFHANSLRILPETFNHNMDLDSDRANSYLKGLLLEAEKRFQPHAPPSQLWSQFYAQFQAVRNIVPN
jgi:hypothetical protein